MTISVPETLKDITLKQYQNFTRTNEGSNDEQFVIHRLVSIFCDMKMSDTMKLQLHEAEEIAEDIIEVLNQDGKLQTTFEHNGKTWGMIQDLTNISLGEYVDLEEGLKDVQTFHRAMAVLYRPVTRQYKGLYDIEEYEGASKYQEEAKSFPMDVVQAAVVFFYSLSNELLKLTPHSFQTMEKKSSKQTTPQKDSSQKSTAGLPVFTSLAQETLINLNKLLNKNLSLL